MGLLIAIRNRMAADYPDKRDGKVTEEFWEKMADWAKTEEWSALLDDFRTFTPFALESKTPH